jgi:hypothetical protein
MGNNCYNNLSLCLIHSAPGGVFLITHVGDDGFTLVEIVVAVLPQVIGAFFYSGINPGISNSWRGRDKVKSVSVVQEVTEEFTSSNLKPHVGRGDIACDEWIPRRHYSVR